MMSKNLNMQATFLIRMSESLGFDLQKNTSQNVINQVIQSDLVSPSWRSLNLWKGLLNHPKKSTKNCQEPRFKNQMQVCLHVFNVISGWWFQPVWKIFVKMGIFPYFRDENKKCLRCHHPDK